MSDNDQKASMLFSISAEMINKLKATSELSPSEHLVNAIESILLFRETIFGKLSSSEITRLCAFANLIMAHQEDFTFTWNMNTTGIIVFIVNNEKVYYTEYEDRHQVVNLITKHADQTDVVIKDIIRKYENYRDKKTDNSLKEFVAKLQVINNDPALSNLKIKEK